MSVVPSRSLLSSVKQTTLNLLFAVEVIGESIISPSLIQYISPLLVTTTTFPLLLQVKVTVGISFIKESDLFKFKIEFLDEYFPNSDDYDKAMYIADNLSESEPIDYLMDEWDDIAETIKSHWND